MGADWNELHQRLVCPGTTRTLYYGLPWNIRSTGKNNRNHGYAQKHDDDSLLCSFTWTHDAKEWITSKECTKSTLGKEREEEEQKKNWNL